MPRSPPTERQVADLIRKLQRGNHDLEAEIVERIWDELKGFRDRQAVTMQLHNLEDSEYG